MNRIAVVISFLLPLSLAPHLFFYYDITPKIAILFAAAAIVLILAAFHLDSLQAFCGTAPGRAFFYALLSLVAFTGFSTLWSAHASLAWSGSNWRRFGALTQVVCLVSASVLAASPRGKKEHLVPLFRAICAAGVLAAVYGILQYFGWDPLLTASSYESGEGVFRIVRPPGPMGHSDYFAAFLLWPVFLGLALSRMEPASRWLGWASALTGAVAILLSGSRGALLGLALGALFYGGLARPKFRVWAPAIAFALVALGVFYFSPLGDRLRARAHWIGEDPAGGARLLLWRDSLKMAATHPWAGFGPDNFVADFPQFQSVELARLYPDFYHESPHNLWLDTLSGQGIPGLLAQLAILALALTAGVRSLRTKPEIAAGLLAGLIAVLVAHQFAVFTVVNAWYFYLGCALLISLLPQQETVRVGFKPQAFVLGMGSAAAILLCWVTFRLVSTDLALASVERNLAAGNTPAAAASYRRAVELRGSGVTADLYFSRRWARAASDAHDAFPKLYLAQLAAGSANLATQLPEGSPNAWFNVAELAASRGNSDLTESALRTAIAQSPNWFKPHWALARLLYLQGRPEQAQQESVRAMQLNPKDQEVAATLAPILSFRVAPAASPTP